MRKTISLVYIAALILLGVVLWIFWRQYFLPPEDLVKSFNEVDLSVNEFLVERGIDDNLIIEQYQKEVKKGGFLWIESYKKIEYEADGFPPNFLRPLEAKLRKIEGTFIFKTAEKGKLIVEVGKDSRIFHKLLFVLSDGKSVKKKGERLVAIVIDDLGYSKGVIEEFVGLGIPMSYAILPGERFTAVLAEYLRENKQEYILHMPMEPEGYPEVNPGAYSLLKSMSKKEIREKALKLIGSVPDIMGVNNHMGSAFTADEASMKPFLEVMRESGLYFLDSRTSLESKASAVAGKLEYPILVNNVFLDTDRSREKILEQLDIARKIAVRRGICIAIGHVTAKDLPGCLAEVKEAFEEDGIRFVTLSEMKGVYGL